MKGKKQKEIFFKAGRRKSETCEDYRQIIKRGDLEEELYTNSDDVIKVYTDDISSFGIDCNKKTGEFRLFFTRNKNEN